MKATKENVCLTLNRSVVSNPLFKIELRQSGIDNFTVQYGKQIKTGLTYDRACTELGAAIMHFLSCEGKVDNREPGDDE